MEEEGEDKSKELQDKDDTPDDDKELWEEESEDKLKEQWDEDEAPDKSKPLQEEETEDELKGRMRKQLVMKRRNAIML